MRIKNIVLIIVGSLSLLLGAVGIFLPLIPTTPFVLLSAGCFSVSNPRMAELLKRNKYFGSYIDNYQDKTGVPRKVKIKSILILWIGLIISMILISKLIMIIILMLIGVMVSLHILSLKNRE
jgi:uncharacterized membrane protein YbaN (DUF454 family)